MSAIPLARYLVEFGSETDFGLARGNCSGARTGEAPARVAEETAARVAEAVARGQEEGRAAAEDEFGARLEAQREEFAQRLTSERQAWAAQEGEALAERMLAAMHDLEARIGESAARILHPFLTAQLRCHAVAELAALIQTAVSKDRNAALAVSGPDDLIGALREKLAGATINVTFSTGDAPDVQVTLNHTILQTRLEAWMARIQEAVA